MNDEESRVSEEPAWLSAKADQRIALMVEKSGGAHFPSGAMVVTPLTEPGEGATRAEMDRWDRSCDNCGRFLPVGELIFTGQCVRILEGGHRVIITFGACGPCIGRG